VDEFTVTIHGTPRSADPIQERVRICRKVHWYWHKRPWKMQDTAIHRASGGVSFDLSLAADNENFDLQRGGWQKDRLLHLRVGVILSLRPSPSTASRTTNRRDWVCSECHDKFLQGPDYFSTSHPELT